MPKGYDTDETVQLDDGPVRTIVAHNGDPEGRPATLVLGEIWGANRFVRDLCLRLANEGITAVGPDPYRGDLPPTDDAPVEALYASFDAYDDIRGIRDLRALLRKVRGGELGFRPGPVFVWGFCMGGRFAHYLAALDEDLAGVINTYGRVDFPRHPDRKPFTPLDVSGLIGVPYLGLFAAHDPVISAEDVRNLDRVLTAHSVPHGIRVYEGAEHGFFNPTRHSHHAAAAADAWQLAVRFLKTKALPQ